MMELVEWYGWNTNGDVVVASLNIDIKTLTDVFGDDMVVLPLLNVNYYKFLNDSNSLWVITVAEVMNRWP